VDAALPVVTLIRLVAERAADLIRTVRRIRIHAHVRDFFLVLARLAAVAVDAAECTVDFVVEETVISGCIDIHLQPSRNLRDRAASAFAF
jgi:hypothetical protein